MSTVLLTWELGAGTGHCVNLCPVADALCGQGHQVVAAVRNLATARRVFDSLPVKLLQAPYKGTWPEKRIPEPRNFAQILHNIGFGDDNELDALASAWRQLYAMIKPDLVAFEHSPTALLAARGIDFYRVVLGNAFHSPPEVSPLPDLRPWLPADDDPMPDCEDQIIKRLNRQLASWNQAPLERIGQLFSEVDENFILSLAEFDCYGPRDGTRYWGKWSASGGDITNWPRSSGAKVFAYLQLRHSLPHLLAQLTRMEVSGLIYAGGLDEGTKRRFENERLRFLDHKADVSHLAAECDFVIANGNAGTTTAFLLHGIPILQIPHNLEQLLNSQKTVKLGAGLLSPPDQLKRLSLCLASLINEPKYAVAAREFAQRYSNYNPRESLRELVRRVEKLVQG